jgi:hypothetical protein
MFIRTRRPWFDCDRDAVLMEMLAGVAERPLGLKRHFVPRRIRDDEFTLFSSCSAMPLFDWAHETCAVPYQFVIAGEDRGDVANLLLQLGHLFLSRFLSWIAAPKGTRMLVASSPADAFRMAAMLFAIECNGEPMRWLVPSIGEAASEVPFRMREHVVRPGVDYGKALLAENIEVVEIPLRKPWGELIDETEIAEIFRRHQQTPGRRPIGVMSYGDATGAAGPLGFQADMMDATQMRMRPSRIGEYLRRGYPTVISGSTFLGGPMESGALLVPPDYFSESVMRQAREMFVEDTALNWKTGIGFSRGFANMLRWMPGLAALETLAGLGPKAETRMACMTMEMRAFLAEYPDFEVVESRSDRHVEFCGRDSGIVPFFVRRSGHASLSMPEVIALYERLAAQNVLLGLPMTIGHRAALRLSISAGDLTIGSIAHKLARLADVLCEAGFQRRTPRALRAGSASQARGLLRRPDGVCLQ